jgi:hypothetical protein
LVVVVMVEVVVEEKEEEEEEEEDEEDKERRRRSGSSERKNAKKDTPQPHKFTQSQPLSPIIYSQILVFNGFTKFKGKTTFYYAICC